MTSPMPRPAAILFDLDGTLIDTLDDLTASVNRCLAGLRLPPRSREEVRSFVGEGMAVLARRSLPAERVEQQDLMFERLREDYGAHALERTRPYPGILELLDRLAAQGIPLAVLSNKPDPFTRMLVEELLGQDTFAVVCGQRPEVPRKPDPAGALEIARQLGLTPQQCLFVGDSAVDMLTARAAGMECAGVLWGYRDEEDLRRGGAGVLLARPGELLGLWAGH